LTTSRPSLRRQADGLGAATGGELHGGNGGDGTRPGVDWGNAGLIQVNHG